MYDLRMMAAHHRDVVLEAVARDEAEQGLSRVIFVTATPPSVAKG